LVLEKAASIKVGKLEAALRQLQTAITLWFNDGDPVATHTLAFAAYEIIHVISKKRNPNRGDLLFDSMLINDEYRDQFNLGIKKHANFFKHANKDGEAEVEFSPLLAEVFIFYAIAGREFCGEPSSIEESAFVWWIQIHKPDFLTKNGRKLVADLIPTGLDYIRSLSKRDFFHTFCEARRIRANSILPRVSG
jgi:hypothetical protein